MQSTAAANATNKSIATETFVVWPPKIKIKIQVNVRALSYQSKWRASRNVAPHKKQEIEMQSTIWFCFVLFRSFMFIESKKCIKNIVNARES